MPKRTDIDSILIIGAGPIIIGQACEFDYSGTQAVKALQHDIKTFVGSSAQIEPQAEGSMERSMGKAKRVLDLRG